MTGLGEQVGSRTGMDLPPTGEGSLAHRELASQILDRWDQGEPADAADALAKHPELKADKSAVLGLVYEEYCRRRDAGEVIDAEQFCQRFPSFRHSVRRMLSIQRFIHFNPQLVSHEKGAKWPTPGSVFLGFCLVRELGRGAFARVFLATQPALGNRHVVVKLSRHGTSEAAILGRLSHPHVVPIHSVQKEGHTGLTAICMPYLGHATLDDVIDHVFGQPRIPTGAAVIREAARQGIPADELAADPYAPAARFPQGTYVEGVLSLAVQIAEALAVVHAAGVCHGDLKPSNVLLTPVGRPMLLDFNLALDPQGPDQRLGGTLPYMAPEQLRAFGSDAPVQPLPVDARSDLFSLGVMLYQLLTGVHPFGVPGGKLTAQEIVAYLLDKHQRPPRPLSLLNPQVDPARALLIESCLAFRPEDRPSSATHLAAALRRDLWGPRRWQRWAAAHVPALLTGSALVLALTAVGGYGLSQRDPYSVRQLKAGWAAYHQGQYAQAGALFQQALDADPDVPGGCYARGRANLQRGEWVAALGDFEKAMGHGQDGRVQACIGYCMSRLNQDGPALEYYRRAASEFQSAGLFNNLGYTYLSRRQLREARHWLDRAVAANPTLQAAFYNRAKLGFLEPLRPPGPGGSALDDIDHAIRLGPANAELHHLAACLHHQAKHTPEVLNHLGQALALGWDAQDLKGARFFKGLWADARFQDLCRSADGPASPQQAVWVVDPVTDLPD